MMTTEIRAPDLKGVQSIAIGRWFKRVGDPVTFDEPLVVNISDRTTQEVRATTTGVLSEILAKDGTSVVQGALLGAISVY